MTKLEKLKFACDAAHDALDDAYAAYVASSHAYVDELKKTGRAYNAELKK